jgi:AraC-like DNA-binding protein
MNIRLRYWLILSSVLFCQLTVGQDSGLLSQCPLVKVEVERLPDLKIPRNGHTAICINGEVTVFGGHTTNFIPTPTAEYYKNGEWYPMEMAYPHDNGLCVVLRSGKVLLAGGHAEPMGVGQSYPVEEYDPETHTFRGFCILSMKRTFASGAELDSGRVVVAGNWYAGDGIELFDGDRTFSPVKEVTMGRAVPFLLRTSDDNILILANESPYAKPLISDKVDRLKGDPLRVPILNNWQPIIFEAPFPNDLSFIGDESKNDYSYLLAMQDWGDNDTTAWNNFSRQLGFVLVRDTTFSLLPTICSVPRTGFSPSDSIIWNSPLIADRKAYRGYVHGVDLQGRSYVLCVEYDKRPAPLTLYYSDVLTDAGSPMIVLTDDGDLMMVGGHNFNKGHGGQLENDNFSPLASVYLLHLGTRIAATSAASAHGRSWWIALAIVAVFAIVMLLLRKRCIGTTKSDGHDSEQNLAISPSDSATNDELIQRICELMESRKLYLNSDLKLNDVAAMLGTNRNQISTCINSKRGYSFSQFVGSYRIEYAKELMRRQKDIKIAEVWMQSGFTNETSFFRTFKLVTGLTPNEWKSNDYN